VFTRGVLLFVLALIPDVASAQPKWDIAGAGGFLAGYTPRPEDATGYQETWFQNIQGAAIVGRHFSTHLKLELEASLTTRGSQFRERLVNVPGTTTPYSIGSEVFTQVGSVGASATYQFGRNEWVHPFVQAGVSADFDRQTVRTWEQFVYSGGRLPPQRVVEERMDGPTTHRAIRGVIGGGAKLYVSERAFFRTDSRWTFGRDRHHWAARIGFGVDL
jgi:hypothetical protein